MIVCCLSDTHGYLPTVPACDLLLLAGDYCPYLRNGADWYTGQFASWLEQLRDRGTKVVGVAGNHDWPLHDNPEMAASLPWTYLLDSHTVVNGLKIYGAPWQPKFCNWAFNLNGTDRKAKWELIPADADILLLHGPPKGHLDSVSKLAPSLGCSHLTKRLAALSARMVVFGHIHPGYGHKASKGKLFVNAAHVNQYSMPTNKPQLFQLDSDKQIEILNDQIHRARRRTTPRGDVPVGERTSIYTAEVPGSQPDQGSAS